MASVVLLVSGATFATFRDARGKSAALGSKISIWTWESKHPSLDVLASGGSLYLLTKRSNKALWLVAVLHALRKTRTGWTSRVGLNTTPVVDITSLREPLALARLGPTPRALDARDAAIMDQVRIDALHARGFVVEAPEQLPEAPRPPRRYPRLPKLAGELGPGCLAQIEGVLDDLRARPDRYLSRAGTFVADVQGIYDGVFDRKEAERILRGELAPFAGRDRDVDKVAKRAVDELCRGMVALALGRDRDVPASCATLRTPLARYAAVVKKLLDSPQ